MGVIYKLKDEVVQYIISQRQNNPLSSCRQLAESASREFGLHLSKSSVHDVLKESGIITPRGRKPKDKFEIPQEKKEQIQVSLSQVKLLPFQAGPKDPVILDPSTSPRADSAKKDPSYIPEDDNDTKISPEYDGAGKIFLKAALWDLGVFSPEKIKDMDWAYYLTYSKGVKVDLENNKSFFIDLPLPLERCIRELADGLINNVRPFVINKVSDEEFFKASMGALEGFKIKNVSIVGHNDHILFSYGNIMEFSREYLFKNMVFVETNENNFLERSKLIFFSQILDNIDVIDSIMNLDGFNTTNKCENIVSLIIPANYDNETVLQQAAETLNGMFLRDEEDRLVKVKIQAIV